MENNWDNNYCIKKVFIVNDYCPGKYFKDFSCKENYDSLK